MMYLDCLNFFKEYIGSYCMPDTVEYYNINLRLFSSWLVGVKGTLRFDINTLTKHDYISYISFQRSRGVKNTSVRTYARAVKAFLRFCYNEGYLLNNITLNVKFPKSDKKIIIPLSQKRVAVLHSAMLKGYMSKRNICIFYLMLDCGLRLGEVVALNKADVNFDDSYITVVNSKNNKSRIVPMSENVKWYLHQYINDYRYFSKTALILDNHYEKRINKNSIELVFNKLKRYDDDIHPHLLRHTFATSYILGGGSLEVLRVLMGHADYNVTKEYLHIASQVRIADFDIYKLDDVFFKVYNYNKN